MTRCEMTRHLTAMALQRDSTQLNSTRDKDTSHLQTGLQTQNLRNTFRSNCGRTLCDQTVLLLREMVVVKG